MSDGVGKSLNGRAPGVSLNEHGVAQAEVLAERFRNEPIVAIYSSPLERARETANAIAAPHEMTPCIDAALNEIDFGEWTGLSLNELELRPRWKTFNERRSTTRVPRGESMLEVQARVVASIDTMFGKHQTQSVVAVSHGDVIKSALAHYLRISLDHILLFDIDPASVTMLDVERSGTRVVRLNC
jgi:ribonuclease H / adenosylcobalamin/alpha-ribazole phosphatase